MSLNKETLVTKQGLSGERNRVDSSALNAIHGPSLNIRAGQELIFQGQSPRAAFFLQKGWAYSYKTLSDGRRQVIDLQVRGDYLGLSSILLSASDRGYIALTDLSVVRIETKHLLLAMSASSFLAQSLILATCSESARVVEHLVSLGKRDATSRLAHLLFELDERMRLAGQGTATGFECPVSQGVLADALGMTPIHLNRVLRQLREAGLLTFRKGVVTFLDRQGLAELTDFDRAYLVAGPNIQA